ncbi:MAG: flavoprotein [Pirellulaceae bacterium]|nr:MAG: flavoprotein [Pirellulaceae bacterium]
MTHVLITSGPTRQYLDPVRYLTNASSGRMGRALAEAALALGYRVTIVSGPVALRYPRQAELVEVESTEQMLQACQQFFPRCDGLIAAAAPCDYRPQVVSDRKLVKTGQPLTLVLEETPDIVATLAAGKRPEQWIVGFALETHDARLNALAKLERKSCDLMVINGPEAMNAATNHVEIVDRQGRQIDCITGSKELVAQALLAVIDQLLVRRLPPSL